MITKDTPHEGINLIQGEKKEEDIRDTKSLVMKRSGLGRTDKM